MNKPSHYKDRNNKPKLRRRPGACCPFLLGNNTAVTNSIAERHKQTSVGRFHGLKRRITNPPSCFPGINRLRKRAAPVPRPVSCILALTGKHDSAAPTVEVKHRDVGRAARVTTCGRGITFQKTGSDPLSYCTCKITQIYSAASSSLTLFSRSEQNEQVSDSRPAHKPRYKNV